MFARWPKTKSRKTLFIITLLVALAVLAHFVLVTAHPDYRKNNVCSFFDESTCQKIPFCKPVYIETNPCKTGEQELCLTVIYPPIFQECSLKEASVNSRSTQENPSSNSKVSVIVELNIPFVAEANLTPDEIAAQRARIKDTQNQLLSELPGTFSVYKTYTITPSLALVVDQVALNFLKSSTLVKTVQEDKPVPPLN